MKEASGRYANNGLVVGAPSANGASRLSFMPTLHRAQQNSATIHSSSSSKSSPLTKSHTLEKHDLFASSPSMRNNTFTRNGGETSPPARVLTNAGLPKRLGPTAASLDQSPQESVTISRKLTAKRNA
jgi:hypothetical protein